MTPLVPLILLAVALRLLGALLRPVWVDEAASAIFTAGNSSWRTWVMRVRGSRGCEKGVHRGATSVKKLFRSGTCRIIGESAMASFQAVVRWRFLKL